MQAFLWRHLVPAEELMALAYNPSYQSVPARVPPEAPAKPDKPSSAAAKPPAGKPKFTKQQVKGLLRQLKRLYEEWLITDSFYQRKVAECEAGL